MIIQKGSNIKILHQRKGMIYVRATESFDPETTEWWPVVATRPIPLVRGMIYIDDQVSCRGSFCTICEA